MTGGVDDVVAAAVEGGLPVESQRDVGRNAVLVVFAVEGEGTGDGVAVTPVVGQHAHRGKSHSARGGVAHQTHVVIGLCADGEGAGGAETATVDKYDDGEVEGIAVGHRGGIGGGQRGGNSWRVVSPSRV